MTRYQVLVAAPAEAEIEAAYLFIRADSPANAAAWRAGLYEAAMSLKSFPERCAVAPENGPFEFEIRQFVYGNYRLLFTIRDDDVVILHVRHGARQWMAADEIELPYGG